MSNFWEISNIVLWIVLLVLVFFMFMLSKLVADFLNRFRTRNSHISDATSLKIGEKAPAFLEVNQYGQPVRLADTMGKITLLLFTDPDCRIHQEMGRHTEVLSCILERIRVIVMLDSEEQVTQEGEPGMEYIHSPAMKSYYFIKTVPSVILIDQDERILDVQTIKTWKHLVALIDQTLRTEAILAKTLKIGEGR